MWRLEATREEIDKLFEVYQLSKLKSITYLCQNITLSLKLLQSEPRKLLDYGYMLLAFPRYTDSILNDTHPSIKPFIRDAIRRVPKLFTIAPKNYYQNYEILKVSNFQVICLSLTGYRQYFYRSLVYRINKWSRIRGRF